jgi:apolipoprotein D and lipocalin family protein
MRVALQSCAIVLLFLSALGCASRSGDSLQASRRPIELERFMGDWYVIGSIPIALPGFSEEGAHNAVESYSLSDDGTIRTTYTFRKGAFDGPERRFTPKGWVYDEETNTEWRMQFVWPFKAAYLIVWVDEEYTEAIIGVPSRSNVWLLSREPNPPEDRYQRLVARTAAHGYDRDAIQRVPQRWSSTEEGG